MSDMNMALNEEALPEINESELVFGAKIAPPPEGTYAIRSSLGKNGVKYDDAKKSYTVHCVNRVVKALKVTDPKNGRVVSGEELTDGQKILFKEDGTGREIHDFFRISNTNEPGIRKAMQFLKYAGDPDYNKYATPGKLAKAMEDALTQEPDSLKLNGRWRASVETGTDAATGKKTYANANGVRKFPKNPDGSISHVIELDGEFVAAQFEVVEYGELTAKDAA